MSTKTTHISFILEILLLINRTQPKEGKKTNVQNVKRNKWRQVLENVRNEKKKFAF